MFKLYEIPEKSKIYFGEDVVIFDHIDGLYSYCYLEKDKSKIVHLHACTNLAKFKDGYLFLLQGRE